MELASYSSIHSRSLASNLSNTQVREPYEEYDVGEGEALLRGPSAATTHSSLAPQDGRMRKGDSGRSEEERSE